MNEEIDHIVVTDKSIGIYYLKREEYLLPLSEGYSIDEFESGLIVIEHNHKPYLLVSIHRIKHLRYV